MRADMRAGIDHDLGASGAGIVACPRLLFPLSQMTITCILLSTLKVHACEPKSARDILGQLQNVQPAVSFSGVTVGGREWLPLNVWREMRLRTNDVVRTDYYGVSRGDGKGRLIAREYDLYRGADLECVLWADAGGALLRVEKVIKTESLIKTGGHEVVLNGYVIYSPNGEVEGVNETISLRIGKRKEGYFCNLAIGKNAVVQKLSSGDEELERAQ